MRGFRWLMVGCLVACEGRVAGGTASTEGSAEAACEVRPGAPRLWRLSGPQLLEGLSMFVYGRRPTATGRVSLQAPFVEVPAGDRFSSLDTPALTGVELEAWLSVTRESARLALTELRKNRGLCVSQGFKPTLAACLESTVKQMAPRAFDRPATAEEVQRAVQAGLAMQDVSSDEAVLTALQRLLVSPDFAFRVEPAGRLDAHTLARSLAYALTDAPPDEALMADADAGRLDTPDGLASAIERLMNAPRGLDTGVRFVHEYFQLELLRSVAKDNAPNHRPDDLLLDSRALARRWLSGERPFEALLSSREVMASGRTFTSYSLPMLTGTTPMLAEASGRFGMLSQPSWLVGHSHTDSTDPVRRGKFVMESLLCVEVPDLPIEMVPPLPDLGPNATVRGRLAVHSHGTCAGCHTLMDSIGLGLEGFDHLGRTRTMEAGQPVDRSGALVASDVDGPFVGQGELAARLSQSAQVKSCMTRHLATFVAGRLLEGPLDECLVTQASEALGRRGALRDVVSTLYDSRRLREREVTP
jgi:hypothetical protein